jgi:hypothetical protein
VIDSAARETKSSAYREWVGPKLWPFGSTLKMNAMVAKNQERMTTASTVTDEIKLEGPKTFWLIPTGDRAASDVRVKFTRLECGATRPQKIAAPGNPPPMLCSLIGCLPRLIEMPWRP